jgi:uncharacterized protein (DUF2249 family)
MRIDKNTRISHIIKHDERAIELIASVNSHFKKLKNPILRKILAPRVTLAEAAIIGNTSIEELFEVLKSIGFEGDHLKDAAERQIHSVDPQMQKAIESNKMTSLDVRPVLDKGSDPFEHIMDAYEKLNDGFVLKIINSFEPVPLIRIMEEKGIEYWVERDGDLVNTYLLKHYNDRSAVLESKETFYVTEDEMDRLKKQFGSGIQEIDVRMLEMPEPMITILSACENLDKGEALFVHHKKFPQYLVPELENRKMRLHALAIASDNVKLLIYLS